VTGCDRNSDSENGEFDFQLMQLLHFKVNSAFRPSLSRLVISGPC